MQTEEQMQEQEQAEEQIKEQEQAEEQIKEQEQTEEQIQNQEQEEEEQSYIDYLNEVREETREMVVQKKIRNVAIFIDFDNMYYSLKEHGADITKEQDDLCNLLSVIYDKNILRRFNAYADFDKIHINMTRLQTSRVRIMHVYGNGKEEQFRKNASDIELSLDAMETYYANPEIDTYVFVTSDSDMIPIMDRLKFKGKHVILYYIKQNASQAQDITIYADEAYDIIKLLNVTSERENPEYWLSIAERVLREWKDMPINQRKFLSSRWAQNEISKGCCVTHSLASKILKLMVKKKIMEVKEIDGKLSYEFAE